MQTNWIIIVLHSLLPIMIWFTAHSKKKKKNEEEIWVLCNFSGKTGCGKEEIILIWNPWRCYQNMLIAKLCYSDGLEYIQDDRESPTRWNQAAITAAINLFICSVFMDSTAFVTGMSTTSLSVIKHHGVSIFLIFTYLRFLESYLFIVITEVDSKLQLKLAVR